MPIRKIKANISELIIDTESLILDADASSGSSTITVKSIIGASTNNILLFRYPGNESAEIIATHASTPPSGNTITLASSLVESHPAGTKIYIIRANQVRFYHASSEVDANSDDSSLSALSAAQSIDPTMIENIYEDTVQTSGYYYYRFIDSINSVNLLYSDPIPWNIIEPQFAENEVGYVLEFVKRKLGHEWNERFSKKTAIDEINDCLKYIQGKMKKWARYLVSDYSVGQTSRGIFEVNLPSDIYDSETNKSILQVRIGTAIDSLSPADEKEFDAQMDQVVHTQVRTQATSGDTTLEIDNSYDFDDSGSVKVYINNTAYSITYTGITRSATAGVLTGIPASGTGSITVTIPVDTNVWQNEKEGKPLYFNVRQQKMRYWPMPDSTWQNKNIFLDYYNSVTSVDSESDSLDVDRYDMVKEWLLWKGKSYWRNNGVDDLKDSNLLLFQDILKTAIRNSISGQKYKMTPKLNRIEYNTRPVGKFQNT